MFECKRKIRLYDTDAAGLLFYANQLHVVHDTLEEFFEEAGMPVRTFMGKRDYLFPVVHVESSYFAPLTTGDVVTVQMNVRNLGTTSFTFHYRITSPTGEPCGEAAVTHVVLDSDRRSKRPIPDELRRVLEAHLA